MRGKALTAVAALALVVGATTALAYSDGAPVTGTAVAVADGPDNQTDPHASGSLVSYTDDSGGFSRIRYRDLATGATGSAAAEAGAYDLLSDVSGSRIVFLRATSPTATIMDSYNIYLIDTATGSTRALDFKPAAERSNPAIGGDTVVWEDTMSGQRELYVHDLATGMTAPLATGADSFGGDVSPAGDVVVWLTQTAAGTEAREARRAGGIWTTKVVAPADGVFTGIGTDGSIVAYVRGGDIRWQPVGGGPERTVVLAGDDYAPSVAGGSIVFEHEAGSNGSNPDVLLYDTATDVLRSVASTPSSETLSDVASRRDGSLLITWAQPSAARDLDVRALVTPAKDGDGDGVPDVDDNCATVANPGQADANGNGVGDACERDAATRIADLVDQTLVALDRPVLAPTLKARLQAAVTAYLAGNTAGACAALRLYEWAVQAAPASAFTPAEKASLISESQAIRRDLGC